MRKKEQVDLRQRSLEEHGDCCKYDELTDTVIHLTPGPVDTVQGKQQK